jgi:hypothetical protein
LKKKKRKNLFLFPIGHGSSRLSQITANHRRWLNRAAAGPP